MKVSREEEIDGVLSTLAQYWKARPQLRLGQIIINMSEGVSPFHISDSMLHQHLFERLDEKYTEGERI